jgi:hypothetical protein
LGFAERQKEGSVWQGMQSNALMFLVECILASEDLSGHLKGNDEQLKGSEGGGDY